MSRTKRFGNINGYRVWYTGKLTDSGQDEYVYEHILIAEKMLGRSLKKREVVHHLDLDKSNNRLANLLVLSKSMHAKLHQWINSGCPMLDPPFKEMARQKKQHRQCGVCKATLTTTSKYCSSECSHVAQRRVERPSKRRLRKLLMKTSYEAIGRRYKVTGNTIKSWACDYGLL